MHQTAILKWGSEERLREELQKLGKLKLKRMFVLFYRFIQPLVEYNLRSGIPSLFFFDLFKLYHFIKEEREG